MKEVATVTWIEREAGFCIDTGSLLMSYLGHEIKNEGLCKNVSPTSLSVS